MGKRGNAKSGFYGRVGTFEDDETDFDMYTTDENCRKPKTGILSEKVIHVVESVGDVVVEKGRQAVDMVKTANKERQMPAPRRKTWFSFGGNSNNNQENYR
eukprot:m.19448 g.19448  ORF g.19448 m.19448 type:complete len:101 (+) comp12458_c0_seq1:201-503(+)